MAVAAGIWYYDGGLTIELHPGEQHNWIADNPDDRSWPMGLWFYYDHDKLERGERVFQGLEVIDISYIEDDWLADLDTLDLPRVDVPEAGLTDASIADVLRWARRTYPSRYSTART